MPGFGAELKRALREPTKVVPYGIPQLVFDCEWSENELAMDGDIASATAEMLEACRVRNVVSRIDNDVSKLTSSPGWP